MPSVEVCHYADGSRRPNSIRDDVVCACLLLIAVGFGGPVILGGDAIYFSVVKPVTFIAAGRQIVVQSVTTEVGKALVRIVLGSPM